MVNVTSRPEPYCPDSAAGASDAASSAAHAIRKEIISVCSQSRVMVGRTGRADNDGSVDQPRVVSRAVVRWFVILSRQAKDLRRPGRGLSAGIVRILRFAQTDRE